MGLKERIADDRAKARAALAQADELLGFLYQKDRRECPIVGPGAWCACTGACSPTWADRYYPVAGAIHEAIERLKAPMPLASAPPAEPR